MATQEEVRRAIQKQLRVRITRSADWSAVQAAVAVTPAGLQAAIALAMRQQDIGRLGRSLQSVFTQYVNSQASLQASAIVSNQSISFEELESIYGPF